MRRLLAVLVAYLGSRAIFAAFDFHYDVFREPFDVGKLVIDFGVFAILLVVCYRLFESVGASRSQDAG